MKPRRFRWLPIPVFWLLVIALRIADLPEAYESTPLLLGLNFAFTTLAAFGVAVLLARAFMAEGDVALVLLGCGVVFWGSAGVVGPAVAGNDVNLAIAIHNICALLSALFHLASALISDAGRRRVVREETRDLWLGAACVVTLLSVVGVSRLALAGSLPVFFVQHEGGTFVRQFVLGTAVTVFVAAAALRWKTERANPSAFTTWYVQALLLLAAGLLGVMLEKVFGGLLSWTGRAAQYAGGIYMMAAACAAIRETNPVTVKRPSEKVAHPYVATGAIVAMAVAGRLIFSQEVDARLTVVIFVPALMLATLYAGPRQGMLAMVSLAVAANYFWVEPLKRWTLGTSVDRLQLSGFLLLGIIVIWIVWALRRLQHRADAMEAKARYAADLEAANEELRIARQEALTLRDDAVAARKETESAQKKAQADAVRMARAQSAVDTVNAMSEGVILLETDGTIVSVNPAVETMAGIRGREVVRRNIAKVLKRFLRGDDLKAARRAFVEMGRGRQPRMEPVLLRRQDQSTIRVAPSLKFIEAPKGGRRMALLTLKDVTALIETERKYRELVMNANSIIMRITPDHRITFFNEYAQRFFGYREDEVRGRSVLDCILPRVDSEGRDNLEMTRHITADPERYTDNENENMRKDGRRVWVHWSNRAVRDEHGVLREILCIGIDVTERTRMQHMNEHYQKRLQRLARQLAENEEQKRWQISRYIHDTIIQNLSISSMRIEALRGKTARDSIENAEALQTIRAMIDESITQCRTVISDLTPALLYELGLVPALEELAESLQEKHETRIEVTADDAFDHEMDHALRGLLFQACRELVMNALKHGGRCVIRVNVNCPGENVCVRVRDNGRGFDPTHLHNHHSQNDGGFGLFSIRERLENLGGCLEIKSAPGQGTDAAIEVPLG